MKPTAFTLHYPYFKKAGELRRVFDSNFADPLKVHSQRFVWDFWHVPNEYSLLRTPANHYFPIRLYERFHRQLVSWGRENLGCHDISPPWLSLYIDGCFQNPHVDIPHGPLAFVYSLTNWEKRKFSGGETFLQSPRVRIPARFNQLLVFDPSVKHGVQKIKGSRDPREGRLVMNGWFVQPRPFWEGALTIRQVEEFFSEGLNPIVAQGLNLGSGFLSMRLEISKTGQVRQIQVLCNTLKKGRSKDLEYLLKSLTQIRFRPKTTSAKLTVPLICQNE